MSSIKIGQTLRGRNALFTITSLFRNRPDGPWLAIGPGQERFLVKTAPPNRLKSEIQMLQLMQGHDSIRQLVDQIEDPASMVLEYMDDSVVDLVTTKQLPNLEIKRALKATFQALAALHDKDLVRTDVKPDNILIKNSKEGARYKLNNLGGSAYSNVPSNSRGQPIGPVMLSAPEVYLGIPWTTKADVWSVAITGIALVSGRYVDLAKGDPPAYDYASPNYVPGSQHERLEPTNGDREAFKGFMHSPVLAQLREAEGQYQPYHLSKVANITQEDFEFFGYVMKFDPRQRPTAKEALQHSWFNGA